jgi:hypothetical protein
LKSLASNKRAKSGNEVEVTVKFPRIDFLNSGIGPS